VAVPAEALSAAGTVASRKLACRAVVARTRSSGCSTTLRASRRLPPTRSSSMSTAIAPMRSLGCATVVSGGLM
jgi:hypothetical protein